MKHPSHLPNLARRRFLSRSALAAAALAAPPSLIALAQTPVDDVPRSPNGSGFENVAWKLTPLPMTDVRLRSGPLYNALEIDRRYLHSLPNDRLLFNFRVQAGLPAPSQPFGGWEDPKCELRGHFTGGHYLSACALAFASTGDADLLAKANGLVTALAQCQSSDGYLSAFPREFFERLKNGEKVWAPFYTLHKIMAGHLDMFVHAQNEQALGTAEKMAAWVAGYLQPIGQEQWTRMQKVEFGGMNEVLYNLYAVTGKEEYLTLGRRFDDQSLFTPLAARQDQLAGLHANTNIPKVIGAARAYELTGEPRYREIAEYFWSEVTTQHAYSTGGTSNGEHWQAAGKLADQLGPDDEECCCSYNMLKLTRHLHGWSGDPRFVDYYERVLFNARLGTQDSEGRLMYFLTLAPGLWKTFGTLEDSFWCCTGTGVEEYAKTNDSIYWHDGRGLYVNLFAASEAAWKERGIRVVQDTRFPEEQQTTLTVHLNGRQRFQLSVRVPYWASREVSASVNGKPVSAHAAPGTYLRVERDWADGDTLQVQLPMHLHSDPLPGDATLQAAMYGPLVLAARMGSDGLTPDMIYGHYGPHPPSPAPSALQVSGSQISDWLAPSPGTPLAFEAATASGKVPVAPLNSIFNERYSVYWKVNPRAA
jgi:uncharacterized protein